MRITCKAHDTAIRLLHDAYERCFVHKCIYIQDEVQTFSKECLPFHQNGCSMVSQQINKMYNS